MNYQPLIYIVDDDVSILEGIGLVLETSGFVYQAFSSAEQFLNEFDPYTPACLLLDINMPGIKGDELQEELRRRNVTLPIIFLTAHADIPMTVRTIKGGAFDFLTKPVSSELLIDRLQQVMITIEGTEADFGFQISFRDSLKTLTSRELQVLPFALAGLPNKEIALKLAISYRTVEVHRIRILKKTGAFNFLELAKLCEKHKIQLAKFS